MYGFGVEQKDFDYLHNFRSIFQDWNAAQLQASSTKKQWSRGEASPNPKSIDRERELRLAVEAKAPRVFTILKNAGELRPIVHVLPDGSEQSFSVEVYLMDPKMVNDVTRVLDEALERIEEAHPTLPRRSLRGAIEALQVLKSPEVKSEDKLYASLPGRIEAVEKALKSSEPWTRQNKLAVAGLSLTLAIALIGALVVAARELAETKIQLRETQDRLEKLEQKFQRVVLKP